MSNRPLIIVGCTDRKSLRIQLALHKLPKYLSTEDASKIWVGNYKKKTEKLIQSEKLRNLYQGEYWKVALDIERKFNTIVASAGIGMHDFDDLAIGYTATFSHGVEDSVLRFSSDSNIKARQTWWKLLNRRGSLGSSQWMTQYAPTIGRRTVFVVVSEGYQQALSNDLLKIADEWANVIVVSGSKALKSLVSHKDIHHIQVGQELRMILGGSTPCIGIRFVRDFLDLNVGWKPESVIHHQEILRLRYQRLPEAKKLPVISRTPFRDDAEVAKWIRATIKEQKIVNPTKSNLLQLLRHEGRACEQKRFGTLFEEVVSRTRSTKNPTSKAH